MNIVVIRKYAFLKQNSHKPLKLRNTYNNATEIDGNIRTAFFSRFCFNFSQYCCYFRWRVHLIPPFGHPLIQSLYPDPYKLKAQFAIFLFKEPLKYGHLGQFFCGLLVTELAGYHCTLSCPLTTPRSNSPRKCCLHHILD